LTVVVIYCCILDACFGFGHDWRHSIGAENGYTGRALERCPPSVLDIKVGPGQRTR
jgi:hypothetical protein